MVAFLVLQFNKVPSAELYRSSFFDSKLWTEVDTDHVIKTSQWRFSAHYENQNPNHHYHHHYHHRHHHHHHHYHHNYHYHHNHPHPHLHRYHPHEHHGFMALAIVLIKVPQFCTDMTISKLY